MSPSNTAGDTRRSLTARLQAEILRLRTPALVALSNTDYPVLYALRPDGTRVAIVAMRLHDQWWFVTGDSAPIPADNPEMAARSLVAGPKGGVRELFSRRPRPRGSQVAATAA
ncbi:hypothetical protein NORO109296_06385 [Nocardiopsis rhodophaea]